MSQIGLERGGFSIQKCREKFRGILDLLIAIASLQASFLTLDEKIKVSVEKAWKGKDLPFSSALISGKVTDDTENRSRGKASEQYGVRGYPTTILIDREGKVVGHFQARDSKLAIEEFEKLLKK